MENDEEISRRYLIRNRYENRLGVKRCWRGDSHNAVYVNWTGNNCCCIAESPKNSSQPSRPTVAHASSRRPLPKIKNCLNTISSRLNIWIRSKSYLMCSSQVGGRKSRVTTNNQLIDWGRISKVHQGVREIFSEWIFLRRENKSENRESFTEEKCKSIRASRK